MVIEECGYVVKTLSTEEERQKAYRLRHEIFAEELKWVGKNEGKRDVDMYDDFAISFGVFSNDSMLAYIRLVPAGNPFMIDNEFSMLVDKNHAVRREADTGETSRFCVSRQARQANGEASLDN